MKPRYRYDWRGTWVLQTHLALYFGWPMTFRVKVLHEVTVEVLNEVSRVWRKESHARRPA
jgi:hypothetical protein